MEYQESIKIKAVNAEVIQSISNTYLKERQRKE